MKYAIALLALTGCLFDNPNYPPPEPLPAELTTCSVDEDCVIVELGCCGSCNGGTAVAVRADRQDEVETTYAENCVGGTSCTMMACPPLEAACIDDTCTAQTGSWE